MMHLMYCLQLVETYTHGRGHAKRQACKLATRQAQRVIISAPGRVCSTVPLCAGTVPHAAQLQAHSWKSIDALTHKPSDHAQICKEVMNMQGEHDETAERIDIRL